MDTYDPKPVDTSHVQLPDDVVALIERLAESIHDVWAQARIAEGWRWGPNRDDFRKEHPSLVPYSQLPDSEQSYDRKTVSETLKIVMALGYRFKKRSEEQG